MPVTCENSESAISSTIRDSLTNNNNSATRAPNSGLSRNQLSASLKQSLLQKVEYVESPPGFGYSIQDSLKAKYTVLKPADERSTVQSVSGKNLIEIYFLIAQLFFPHLLFFVPFNISSHTDIIFVYVKHIYIVI